MRKLFFITILFVTANAFSQGKTLYDVEMVQPKMGQSKAFEKAWKAHVIKFHNGNDKRVIEEIMTGNNAGNLLLISGPSSIADFDMERPTQPAHDADYDLTVTPSVSTFTNYGSYRWVDTLSYNGAMNTDKYSTTVYHLKPGKTGDLTAEIKRAVTINKKINSSASYNTYIKMWAGSNGEVVISTNLKDGFKQLDNTFDPNMRTMNDNFKNAYIQEYGQAAWDNRNKLLPEITNSWETYLSKVRKDLSSTSK